MRIVLPEELSGKKLDIVRFVHPRSGKPAKFLVDAADGDAPKASIFELTRVGSSMRSALIGSELVSDGSLVVAIPLHPLFLIVGVLYDQRHRALPLDVLLELAAGDEMAESIDSQLVEPYLSKVSSDSGAAARLDTEKLKVWLDSYVAKVQRNLPPLVLAQTMKAIQPLDPMAKIEPELEADAKHYAAATLVAESWLPATVAEWYMSTLDFQKLEAAAAAVHESHIVQQSLQFGQSSDAKRSASEPASKAGARTNAKRTKTIKATNNTSILDMFKPKATKATKAATK